MNGPSVTLNLPPELIEQVAERVVELIAERSRDQPEPWIGVAEAAHHLACGTSRVYALVSQHKLPHERDGSRLVFRRSELDRYIENGGAVRAKRAPPDRVPPANKSGAGVPQAPRAVAPGGKS